MLLIDPESGSIVQANAAACAFYGYERDQLCGMNIKDINTLSDEEVQLEMARARAEECKFFRFRHRLASGEIRDVEVYSSPIEGRGKALLHSIIHDITQRERARRLLRKSEAELRAIHENTPIPILLVDEKRRIVKLNSCALRLAQSSLEEILGSPPGEAFCCVFADNPDGGCGLGHACSSCGINRAIATTLTTGRPVRRAEAELQARSSEGVARASILVSTTLMAELDTRTVLVCLEDVTEMKQIERSLRTSEQRLKEAQAIAKLGHWSFDLRSRELSGSDELFSIFGLEHDETTIDDFIARVAPENRDSHLDPIRRAVQSGEPWDMEHRLVMKDGTEKVVHSRGETATGPDHSVVSLFGTIQDITERRQTEEHLRRIQALESLGTVAGGIAHDFNNMLAGIFGNLELAQLTLPDSHEAHGYLERALESMERAQDLTAQLLTFSRGGAPVLEDVETAELVRASVEDTLRGRAARTEVELPDDLWPLRADRGQIGQVLAHLVLNAVQAMSKTGTVHVSAANVERPQRTHPAPSGKMWVELRIRDEGAGIPATIINRVFEPYFTTKHDGHGLGLAIAHSIVTKHGGQIRIDSEPDVGTTVSLLLPATRPASAPRQHKSRASQPEQNPLHILVMDDDATLRNMATAMLEGCGHSVQTAAEGLEALAMYATARDGARPFDIVIMDLTVPGGMGGMEAIAELLELDPEARVIVTSGYSSDPVLTNFSAHGFAGKLAKPFRLAALKQEIARLSAGD